MSGESHKEMRLNQQKGKFVFEFALCLVCAPLLLVKLIYFGILIHFDFSFDEFFKMELSDYLKENKNFLKKILT